MKALSFFYNENHGGLVRLLESTKDIGVTEHLFIDGRFPGYPDTHTFSTDGSIATIESFAHTKVIFNVYGFIHKFNLGMSYFGDQDEPVLFISCDEYIKGSTDKLEGWLRKKTVQVHENSHIHKIRRYQHHEGNRKGMISKSRIFTQTEFVNLKYTHYWYYWKDIQITSYRHDIFEEMTLHHDDRIRPPLRNQKMDVYQLHNVLKERDIKNLHCGDGRTTV